MSLHSQFDLEDAIDLYLGQMWTETWLSWWVWVNHWIISASSQSQSQQQHRHRCRCNSAIWQDLLLLYLLWIHHSSYSNCGSSNTENINNNNTTMATKTTHPININNHSNFNKQHRHQQPTTITNTTGQGFASKNKFGAHLSENAQSTIDDHNHRNDIFPHLHRHTIEITINHNDSNITMQQHNNNINTTGGGFAGTKKFGALNDMWKYSIADNKWQHISGSKTVNALGVYGTKGWFVVLLLKLLKLLISWLLLTSLLLFALSL